MGLNNKTLEKIALNGNSENVRKLVNDHDLPGNALVAVTGRAHHLDPDIGTSLVTGRNGDRLKHFHIETLALNGPDPARHAIIDKYPTLHPNTIRQLATWAGPEIALHLLQKHGHYMDSFYKDEATSKIISHGDRTTKQRFWDWHRKSNE